MTSLIGPNDFIDYIFKFPDRGSFLGDSVIQQFLPLIDKTGQPGVVLLIYNPVETLYPPTPPIPSTTPLGNPLVVIPQLAVSSVALSGFWAMLTLKAVTKSIPDPLKLEDQTSSVLLEGGAGQLTLEPRGIGIGLEGGGGDLALEGGQGILLLEGGGNTISQLANHPNVQIISDRTRMFAQQSSVIFTKVDISHINIVINVSGVYVRDGLQMMP